MGSKHVDRAERAEAIAETALKAFVSRPRDKVTIASIAAAAGMSYWQVFRYYGSLEAVYRAASARLFGKIAKALRQARDKAMPSNSVSQAIRAYCENLSDVVASEDYAEMLFLLIRDGAAFPSLERAYRKFVVRRVSEDLAVLIGTVGEKHGAIILTPPETPTRLLRAIESTFGLPRLLPRSNIAPASDTRAAVSAAAAEVINATYAIGGARDAA